MIAYKGFRLRDSKLTCRDFIYEEGKTYYTPEAILCSKGFHACAFPLDVFNYYHPIKLSSTFTASPISERRYHKVMLDDVSEDKSYDSKVVAKKITILEEISIGEMIEISKSFFLNPYCLSKNEPDTDRTFDRLSFNSFASGFLIKDDVTKAIPIYEDSYIFDYTEYGAKGILYAQFDKSKGSFMKKMYSIPRTEIEESYSLWRGVPSQYTLDVYNERIRHVRKS